VNKSGEQTAIEVKLLDLETKKVKTLKVQTTTGLPFY
jgi:hypothetical protein